MGSNDTLQALAQALREWFPEMNGQFTAVSDAEITKENVPPLPFGMVAHVVTAFENSETNATSTYAVESILVNFMMKLERYKKEDGGESPFWAHYSYKELMGRLVYHLGDWVSPEGARLTLTQFEIDTSTYAVVLSFRLRHRYKICYTPGKDGCSPSILMDGRPLQISGKACPAEETTSQNCCEKD